MKRIIAIIAAAALALAALAGCGGKSKGGAGNDASSQSGKKYYFESRGVKFAMNDEAAEILKALGETKTKEIPSCAHQGMDKIYYYDNYGYELETYNENGVEYISSIWLASDAVSTPEGLFVGDSEEKMKQLYGEGEGDKGVNIYNDGNTQLSILTEDGKVWNIQYTAVVK